MSPQQIADIMPNGLFFFIKAVNISLDSKQYVLQRLVDRRKQEDTWTATTFRDPTRKFSTTNDAC